MSSVLCLSLLYMVVAFVQCAASDVTVIYEDDTRSSFDAEQAAFGPDIPEDGITGKLVHLKPVNSSCSAYIPDTPPISNGSKLIALMKREGCKFVNMVLAAQNMSYCAVIVFNHEFGGDSIARMIALSGHDAKKVTIPSVFVGNKAGVFLSSYDIRLSPRVFVKIHDEEDEKGSSKFLWMLLITSPLTFIAMLVCCCFKAHCKECCDYMWTPSRRPGRRRQSTVNPSASCPTGCITSTKKSGRKPQIRAEKFKEGHRYDTCPVCLDDFETNDKLWILPCEHEFHVKCIKPWLTERQNSCPVCKRMSISLSILNV